MLQKLGGYPPSVQKFCLSQKISEKWGICTFKYLGSKLTIFEVWTDPYRVRVAPANRKMGQKRGSKRCQKGSKMAILALFRPLFWRFSTNVDFGSSLEIVCTMCRGVVSQKEVWCGYFEKRGFKIGHFRGLSRNLGNQGLGGDGPGAPSLSDPSFDHFFSDFWIRCHNAYTLGVNSNFENSRFWSQISESTNPPFFHSPVWAAVLAELGRDPAPRSRR